jgi:hypothetical protein
MDTKPYLLELEIVARIRRLGFEPIDVYPSLIDGAEFADNSLATFCASRCAAEKLNALNIDQLYDPL